MRPILSPSRSKSESPPANDHKKASLTLSSERGFSSVEINVNLTREASYDSLHRAACELLMAPGDNAISDGEAINHACSNRMRWQSSADPAASLTSLR